MAKKKKMSTGMLYLIGMALVVVGFFCPMFKAGPIEPNGLDFLNFDNFGFVTIGGLLILVGAAAGVVLNFLNVKNRKTLQLVALVASIAGGVILVIGFNDNAIYKVYLDTKVTNEMMSEIIKELGENPQILVVAEGAQEAGFEGEPYEALNTQFGVPGTYNPWG